MHSSGVGRLVDRHPTVSPERLIAQLHPPPTFADVSFESYKPDPAEPSQAAAVQSCLRFCDEAVTRRAGRKKLFGKREVLPGVGLYLDGGFGVGKTHLLASSYYAISTACAAPTAFATFGELTQLAGVFGFAECIDLLSDYVVVCIDEFELDDPGNTTLISRLLSQLVERGASVAATSMLGQRVALRLVSLTDRLYDAGIPVVASGTKLDTIFSDEMLAGGFRKKYLRATSRLLALTIAGQTFPREQT